MICAYSTCSSFGLSANQENWVKVTVLLTKLLTLRIEID